MAPSGEYVTKFSEWMPFDHRVKGLVPDKDGVKKLVPIPPTQETVNTLFPDANINSEDDMLRWYEGQRVKPSSGEAKNGEEAALSPPQARSSSAVAETRRECARTSAGSGS